MGRVVDAPTIRRRDVVSSEITKIITNPTAILALAGAVAANLALAIIEASGVAFSLSDTGEPSSLSDFAVLMFAPVYVFLILPVHSSASEHLDGQHRTSLIATPDRRTLVIAKSAAVLAVVLAAASIALAPARSIIGISAGLGFDDVLLDLGRWVAAYLAMSVIAFSLAGLLRGSVAPLSILIASPIIVATGVLQWPAGLRLLPDQAALSLLGTPGYEVTALPPAIAAIVLAAWIVVVGAGYALALIRRDA